MSTFNEEARKAFNARKGSLIVLRKNEKVPRVDYEGDLTVSNGKKFVKQHMETTVNMLSDRFIDRIYTDGDAALMLFTPLGNKNDKLEESFVKIAHDLKGEILFMKD